MGRPPKHSDVEVLRMFIESTDDPVLFTVEVAELLDMSQQGAYKRLKSLKKMGYVKTKSMSESSARVWWVTHAGREIVAKND